MGDFCFLLSFLKTSYAAASVWSSSCSPSHPSTSGQRPCCSQRWRSGGTWWSNSGPTCSLTLIRLDMTLFLSTTITFHSTVQPVCSSKNKMQMPFKEKHCWVSEQRLSLSRCPSLCSSAPLDLTPPQCQAPLLELSVKMVLLHLPHPRLVCLYTHLPPHRPVSVLQSVMQLTQRLKLQQSEKVHGVCNL